MAPRHVRAVLAVLLVTLGCSSAAAQPGAEQRRLQAAFSLGLARAWDDEGGMGSGAVPEPPIVITRFVVMTAGVRF